MTRVLLAICLVACGKSGGDDRCHRALSHAAEIYEKSDAPAALKKQMRDGFEDGVTACRKENPPAAVLDCTLAAKAMSDLVRCDAMRSGGGSLDESQVRVAEAEAKAHPPEPESPPDAAPPPAIDAEVARGLQMLKDGKHAEAVAYFEALVASREKALGRVHPDLAVALIALSRAQLALGRQAQALELAERAMSMAREIGRARLSSDALFAVAQARWPSDPARAFTEAVDAMNGLSFGDEERDAKRAIQVWLDEHPQPSR